MAEINLQSLTKYFGSNQVINNFTLNVTDGEFIVLVGPSGCGKSTILRMIAGLETITSGIISINGKIVNDLPPKDRDIAMVFQNYSLYPHMTVFENMAFGLKMRKLPRDMITSRVNQTAKILGLTQLLDQSSNMISGGQQQRVALGRAIVREPQVFLFDEPLSNLDAGLRLNMRAELIRLHKKLRATMIYVTHDQIEAMSMSDRLVVINDGNIQQIGPPLEIYEKPANLFVACFIGSPPMNLISCQVTEERDKTYLVGDGLRLLLTKECSKLLRNFSQQEIILGLRPEDFSLKESQDDTSTLSNTIKTSVEYIEPLGNEILATCLIGSGTITVRFPPDKHITPGMHLVLTISRDRIKLFNPNTGEVIS